MRLVIASLALLVGGYGATAVAQATKQSDIRVAQRPREPVNRFTHFEPLLPMAMAPGCGHLRTGPSPSKGAPSLIGCGVVRSLPGSDANTRERLISNFRMLLKSWDKDGDGKLNQSEVETMVNEAFRRMGENVSGGRAHHPELETQRREMLAFYASQDTNHDGYLTLDELLRGPLANFDCMDSNHDGKLSNDEIFDGMERCPSLNLDEYRAKR